MIFTSSIGGYRCSTCMHTDNHRGERVTEMVLLLKDKKQTMYFVYISDQALTLVPPKTGSDGCVFRPPMN